MHHRVLQVFVFLSTMELVIGTKFARVASKDEAIVKEEKLSNRLIQTAWHSVRRYYFTVITQEQSTRRNRGTVANEVITQRTSVRKWRQRWMRTYQGDDPAAFITFFLRMITICVAGEFFNGDNEAVLGLVKRRQNVSSIHVWTGLNS